MVAAEMASPRDRAAGYADRPWQMLIGGELRPARATLPAVHGEELAWIDTLDNGSPIAVMRHDYLMAVEQLRYVAGLALQLRGQTLPVAAPDAFDFTTRDPFGVVGRLIPFNHPLMFAASRIAAPLLAGNCVVSNPPSRPRCRPCAWASWPPASSRPACSTW